MLTIVGDLGYDINITEKGSSYLVGGSGYHTLVGALAIRKFELEFIACVGKDFECHDIEKLGITTNYILKDANDMTTKFINEYRNGIRKVTINMGASRCLCFESFDDYILNSNIIHFSATDPNKQRNYINFLKGKGYSGKIAVDVFDEYCKQYYFETLEVIDECDIVFMNSDEKKILNFNPKNSNKMCIVKNSEYGAECYFNMRYYNAYEECCQLEVQDTTGAGDVLAGAFLALLDSGIGIEDALNQAVVLATKSVKFLGTNKLLYD
ncbi:MAG: carbohydrate kinase family protein [Lachnospiraceae bacterium]|nr:carbohydrate kinase family protein [Lachnospiraceae bacterium]